MITWDVPVFLLLVIVPADMMIFPKCDVAGLIAGGAATHREIRSGSRRPGGRWIRIRSRFGCGLSNHLVFYAAILGMLLADALMLAMQGVAPSFLWARRARDLPDTDDDRDVSWPHVRGSIMARLPP